MTLCPRCSRPLAEGADACTSCGAAADSSVPATRLMSDAAPAAAPVTVRDTSGRAARARSLDGARFYPGEMLAERYRIVALLGTGGMGEVYRADDLKLGQPVALKFLPAELSHDEGARARLYREVRVARQIAHPNVCRVYDAGEIGGHHFISMEYIRGEELASALKRFGRLPEAKATEIARQICAGLAAAHKTGVLHRDLKPANVMLDEHGDARITDFGLAALSEEIEGRDRSSGTPAYMSPEQLRGRELTARSDIYSLGLVLYELFTGRRAFDAPTLAELLRLRETTETPASPASHVNDLDPLVERVILRCLEADPERRPPSALQVAAALPGGDPLAAALAMGETPSPEMVAAAPKEGTLRPAVAAALLAAVAALLAVVCLLSEEAALYRLSPLDKPAEFLRERAREIVRGAGYTARPLDTAHGIFVKFDQLDYITANDRSPARWERLRKERPGAYRYWYRESPRYLVTYGGVAQDLPAHDVSGMVTVYLDASGRLTYLTAVPPQREPAGRAAAAPDWRSLFAAAGLDPAHFREVQSTWVPLHASDARAAWDRTEAAPPDYPVHVEAASFGGRPVYFDVIYPWDLAGRQEEPAETAGRRAFAFMLITVFMLALVGGALLALRNLRLGRGDRRGAFRLALFVFVAYMLIWVFDARHVGAPMQEFMTFLWHLQPALFGACFLWVLYVALEPYVRRRWPGRIISWTRLLAGDWRDPLVGRDILIGAPFGAGLLLVGYLMRVVPEWLGSGPGRPKTVEGRMLGARYFTTALTWQITTALFLSFVFLFLLLLFSNVLRRERLAAAALWFLIGVALALDSNLLSPVGLLFSFGFALLVVVPLYRYGLLAMVAAMFFSHLTSLYPVTSDFSAWYAGDFLLALAVCAALCAYAFRTSLAGQKLLRANLLQD